MVIEPTAATSYMRNINGKCPMGCGSTLFIGEGGFVTCSYLKCPDPGYVSVMMDQLVQFKNMIKAAEGIEQPRP